MDKIITAIVEKINQEAGEEVIFCSDNHGRVFAVKINDGKTFQGGFFTANISRLKTDIQNVFPHLRITSMVSATGDFIIVNFDCAS